jgi:hypothetical protein
VNCGKGSKCKRETPLGSPSGRLEWALPASVRKQSGIASEVNGGSRVKFAAAGSTEYRWPPIKTPLRFGVVRISNWHKTKKAKLIYGLFTLGSSILS